MTLFIILFFALVISFFIHTSKKDFSWIGSMFIGIILVVAFFNLVAILAVPSKYDRFEAEGKVYQQTLNNARENGNQYESAAIIKDVTKWNIKLELKKKNNKKFFRTDYIDERFETLETIQ